MDFVQALLDIRMKEENICEWIVEQILVKERGAYM